MKFIILIITALLIVGCSQDRRSHLGKNFAENELKLALSNNSQNMF